MSVEVINFGCRLNIAEGEAIRLAAGDQDDLIVINSCAVTAEATRQARQAVRRAAKRRPGARIVVTGCAAETDPAMFAGLTEVVSNRVKHLSSSFSRRRESIDPESGSLWIPAFAGMTEEKKPAISGAGHARAFIEVQNGCDHRCTFCIIPYGRGESRSIPAGLVIDRKSVV